MSKEITTVDRWPFYEVALSNVPEVDQDLLKQYRILDLSDNCLRLAEQHIVQAQRPARIPWPLRWAPAPWRAQTAPGPAPEAPPSGSRADPG
eukprot:1841377-Pyramimonas_sp.AAC.1